MDKKQIKEKLLRSAAKDKENALQRKEATKAQYDRNIKLLDAEIMELELIEKAYKTIKP